MKNILSPQLRASELIRDSDFVNAIYNKNYARIQKMVEKKIKESYLDFAQSAIEEMRKKLGDGEKFDLKAIKEMETIVQFTRFFR